MTIHRSIRRLGVLVAAALVVAGCSSSSDGSDDEPADPFADAKRTVTATATGTAIGVPDQLVASVSVVAGGDTAEAVLDDASTKVATLVEKLTASGIEEADIQTTGIDVGPTYDDDGEITGYAASNSLEITMRDLQAAGLQLDAVVGVVGNAARLGGIRLGFNDDDGVISEARVDAVERARAQATEMAEAAGATLGEAITITDDLNGGPVAYEESLRAFSADAAATSVSISEGSEELSVQVQVVFALR